MNLNTKNGENGMITTMFKNGDQIHPPQQDIFGDAFNSICHDSDKQSLNLTDFICGLIQFGIKSLSNKQMEDIFNLMDMNDNHMINKEDFIHFLSYTQPSPSTDHQLQYILLTEIIEICQNHHGDSSLYSSPRHLPQQKQWKLELEESDYFEFSYIPMTSTRAICADYEQQIIKLKSQLKEAIATLKETVSSNAQHIGEHQQAITELKYSLLKQQKEEEAQEILIQSSLEPTTDYNPLEWNINDVQDWLEMINLVQYSKIFKLHQINGSKLLNEIYSWNTQQFIDRLKFKSQQDIDTFLHELGILKQTAPQIYDPHMIEIESSPSPSTDSADSYQNDDEDQLEPPQPDQDNIGDENEEDVEDEEDEDVEYEYHREVMIQLEESENVTLHSVMPNHNDHDHEHEDTIKKQEVVMLKRQISSQNEMITKHNEEIQRIRHREIDQLKSEIQRIEMSKLELIVSTSNEIQNLREIIKNSKKMCQCQGCC